MIKTYYSKYSGKQIDEAVSALIENNIQLEDLSKEVIDFIGANHNDNGGVVVVDLPQSIIDKLKDSSTIILDDSELDFFINCSEKCVIRAGGLEAFDDTLTLFFHLTVRTDTALNFGGNDMFIISVSLETKELQWDLSPGYKNDLFGSDLEHRIGEAMSRIDNLDYHIYETLERITELERRINELEG